MTKAKTKTETLTVMCYFMKDLANIQKVFSSTNEEIRSIDFDRDTDDRHLDLTNPKFQGNKLERTTIRTGEVLDDWNISREYYLKKASTAHLLLDDLELVHERKWKDEVEVEELTA